MTPPSALPAAIAQFIDATNAADSDRFLDAFTPDARLEDWGRVFTGRAGVASWDKTDNIGVQAHFELVDLKTVQEDHEYVVTVTVSGNGHNGTGPITFTLAEGRISTLTIKP